MEARIGNYRLLSYVGKDPLVIHNPPTKEEIDATLDELVLILGLDSKWVLTGGLVVPITRGEFYRKHGDVDIGIGQDDLAGMVENARASNYIFVSRIMVSNVPFTTERVVFYKDIRPREAIARRPKHLRLLRVDAQNRHNPRKDFLDYIDVYVHRFENGRLITNDTEDAFPSHYNDGGYYITSSGNPIPMRSLTYIGAMKKARMKNRDVVDLKVMGNLQVK